MYSAASRKLITVLPLGSGIGSSNSRDQSVTRDIVIIVITGRHTWRGIFVAGIACRAGHAGTAARTRMGAEPRLLGMILANPAAIGASRAFHWDWPDDIIFARAGDVL
jgi:hypothetical protein